MAEDSKSKIKQLAQQIRDNPGDSFSKFALALEFRKQYLPKHARHVSGASLTSVPADLGVYYHLGKLYEEQDRPVDARDLSEARIQKAGTQNKNSTKKELQEALFNVEIEIDDQQNEILYVYSFIRVAPVGNMARPPFSPEQLAYGSKRSHPV